MSFNIRDDFHGWCHYRCMNAVGLWTLQQRWYTYHGTNLEILFFFFQFNNSFDRLIFIIFIYNMLHQQVWGQIFWTTKHIQCGHFDDFTEPDCQFPPDNCTITDVNGHNFSLVNQPFSIQMSPISGSNLLLLAAINSFLKLLFYSCLLIQHVYLTILMHLDFVYILCCCWW